MTGIPREVAEHALKIRPGSRPAKQRLRHFDEEKRRAIDKEIARLLALDSSRKYITPVVSQSCSCMKKEWEMENMCRIHESQQGVPKGFVSFASHKPGSRLNLRLRKPLLS
jgi:hypothetical protein